MVCSAGSPLRVCVLVIMSLMLCIASFKHGVYDMQTESAAKKRLGDTPADSPPKKSCREEPAKNSKNSLQLERDFDKCGNTGGGDAAGCRAEKYD